MKWATITTDVNIDTGEELKLPEWYLKQNYNKIKTEENETEFKNGNAYKKITRQWRPNTQQKIEFGNE